MKIIVLNLPRSLNEEDLSEIFQKHGKVESCNIVMDKEKNSSKGFGFVDMADKEEAKTAIKELHGSKIRSNKIRVKIAEKGN